MEKQILFDNKSFNTYFYPLKILNYGRKEE